MFESPRFKKYFLPGFVFQSMVIGGGYGTGRELVEFFLQYGPLGGLLGMLFVSTVIWCAVCAVTFELARITGSYDYRTFTRQLLGRGWVLYEVCYVVMMLLGLAVIAAAGGSIVQETFKLPYYAGVIGMMAGVGFLVFQGTPVIEKFFSMWSFVLYAVYFVFFVWSLFQLGAGGVSGLVTEEIKPGWFLSGIKYAAYNLVLIPALLFCVRHVQTRKEAISAGLLAGPIGIIPGFFFYLAMVSQHPGVLEHTVPVNHVLGLKIKVAAALKREVLRAFAVSDEYNQDFRFGSSDGTSLHPHPAKRNHFSTRKRRRLRRDRSSPLLAPHGG